MNREVQIYVINNAGTYQKLDLYGNESIRYVDSIKDSRDPGKVFAGYSKDFTVPASDNNNGIFRHYYNPDITNGFDARVRVPAEIRIDGFPYRKGAIKALRVKMKNGRAENYSIVFYGETAGIKDTFLDSKLDSLAYLSLFNHTYTYTNVRDGFENGLEYDSGTLTMDRFPNGTTGARNVIYPSISHTKIYEYNSASTPPFFEAGTTTRLEHDQLKPAVRFRDIFEAIEQNYGISWDYTGFMDEVDFLGMYLWLHRNKGPVVSSEENTSIFYMQDITLDSGSDVRLSGFDLFEVAQIIGSESMDFDFNVSITGTGTYDVRITNVIGGRTVVLEDINNSSNQTFSYSIQTGDQNENFQPEIRVVSRGGITAIDLELVATKFNAAFTGGQASGTYSWPTDTPVIDNLYITENIPDMTILDFMTDVFKMFNLIIRKEGDNYQVETMDVFYSSGQTRNIDQYVDVSSIDIEPSNPYSKINFMFEEGEQFLMQERRELLNDNYGDDSYQIGNFFDGGEYDVKLNGEKILWERMTNDNDGSQSPNLFTSCIDEDLEPYHGAPIYFFCDEVLTLTDIEWEFDSGASASTFYTRCSNTITTGNQATWKSLSFKPELDEYIQGSLSDSLFGAYWSNYISGLYDSQSRKVICKAYFPVSIATTIALNDTLQLQGKEYFINEIDIDLTTGEADLELITKWL